MQAAVHLRVRGRVQGVGFRWFTRRLGAKYDLGGWVRNCDDGSVEIAAAGPAAALEMFVAEVRSGPEGSRVEAVEELDPVNESTLSRPFRSVG